MRPTVMQLLLRFWTRPRVVVREGLSHPSWPRETLLAVFYGIALAMSHARDLGWGELYSLPGILLRILAYGIPLGLFVVAVISGGMRLVRKVAGGNGSFRDNVTAVAFATIPAMEVLLLTFGGLTTFLGRNAFVHASTTDIHGIPLNLGTVVTVIMIVVVVPFVLVFLPWTITITVKSIGEANGIKGWRALGLALMGLLLMMVAGLIVQGLKTLLGINL